MLEGHISEAESETKVLYPNLLDTNPDLLFMLRCRHFVELVGNSMKKQNLVGDTIDHNPQPKRVYNGHGEGVGKSKPTCPWSRSEDMEVTYSNGYQNGNGGGDENMGVCILHLKILKTKV